MEYRSFKATVHLALFRTKDFVYSHLIRTCRSLLHIFKLIHFRKNINAKASNYHDVVVTGCFPVTFSRNGIFGVAAAHILRIANIDVQKVFSDGGQQAYRRAK